MTVSERPAQRSAPTGALKPRLSGARAALGVADAERQAVAYTGRKQIPEAQKRLEELIAQASVTAFPNAPRFVQAVAALGWPMAVAPPSKNAGRMLRLIRLDSGHSLLDVSAADFLRTRPAKGHAGSGDFPAGCWKRQLIPPTASSPRTHLPASSQPAAVA